MKPFTQTKKIFFFKLKIKTTGYELDLSDQCT